MQDSAYKTFLNFLKLLPKSEFKIYDDSDFIDKNEKAEIDELNKMIDNNDFSEFKDFSEIDKDV